MSDSIYGWHAKLNLNDSNYNGCAMVIRINAELEWTLLRKLNAEHWLLYQPRTPNDDHSAITRYSAVMAILLLLNGATATAKSRYGL